MQAKPDSFLGPIHVFNLFWWPKPMLLREIWGSVDRLIRVDSVLFAWVENICRAMQAWDSYTVKSKPIFYSNRRKLNQNISLTPSRSIASSISQNPVIKDTQD